ncbi:M48 family metalloprotease [Sphingorhabdus sp.]|jgi:STE24 endopeptidase|uniref:M48 family metalloprotease n=2 Tax=Sphingorhabdus sp. TaxID=1902408 RepID=UPI003BB12704|nr:M48 family metalloprotease [Sphingomonadales bacterium]MBL0022123.1 M48 family metalloprotease [Sphingomonadales bacterium]
MIVNPAAETAKYIDGLGAEALEKAANYTAGNHWMLLWGLLVSALVTWIIVRWGVLDRIAQKLENRSSALRIWLIAVSFLLISSLLSLPWGVYEEWVRESAYGRTSQPLADFLTQDAISMVISALLGGLFFLGVYALIRKTGKRWWLWSGGLAGLAISAGLLLSPVLIEPIFNDYKPVPEGPVRAALLVMADDAGIPHDRLLMFDGSRQSNNFTANVSGVFGTARIAISDVAMKEASLDEVKAVTGHEVGHYVEGHIWRMVGLFALLAMLGFFLADRLFPAFARVFGSKTSVDDPRGIPVLIFIMGLFGLLGQPLINTVIRQGERDADNYSLRTVNLPDALAGALVKTAEYRYPRPTALQETLFYTHPSVEWRVRNAMEWKAKHRVKRD